MFTITQTAVIRDLIAIACVVVFLSFCMLVYIGFVYFKKKHQGDSIEFRSVLRTTFSLPLVKFGLPTFACFLGAYACKIVLVKMFFALVYAAFLLKIFGGKNNKT